MASNPKTFLTPEQYLEIERKAEFRSEYFAGEMFAMAGASRQHNRITSNAVIKLGNQLEEKPCNIYSSDMRVLIESTGLFTYPDVVVTCGEERFAETAQDNLLNPILIIEVLSDTTEAYDRGKKFELYQQIESLAEYILVSQYEIKVEQFIKQSDKTWLYSQTTAIDSIINLASIDCQLILQDIYSKVVFKGPAPLR